MWEARDAGTAAHLTSACVDVRGRVWAVGHRVLVGSSDGGRSFAARPLDLDVPSRAVVRCAADGTVCVLAPFRVLTSADGGAGWQAFDLYRLSIGPEWLAIGPDGALLMVACDYNGKADRARSAVYRSRDGGRTIDLLQIEDDAFYGAAAYLPGGRILITDRHYLARSDDDGATFRTKLATPFIEATALHVASPSRLWLGTASHPRCVWRSDDGGDRWTQVAQLVSAGVVDIWGDDAVALVCTSDGRVHLAADGATFVDTGLTGMLAVAGSAEALVAVGRDGAVATLAR